MFATLHHIQMIRTTDKSYATTPCIYQVLSRLECSLITIGCNTGEAIGKTGTAETGFEDSRKEYSNGLFICYAPKDNPEVAVALVVEQGKWGSSSVGIAKRLMAAYFNQPVDRTKTNYINNPILGDYLPIVNARASR